MNDVAHSILPPPPTALRWSARTLSALILLFWGYFMVAHLVGDAGRASRPLVMGDYLLLTAMAVWLAGLAAAWKWELIGALTTLSAVLLGAVINWRTLVPGSIIILASVLFLLSWWLNKGR
jgi:hypothetical protein